MSSVSRPQAQWSVDNTIFKSVEVLLQLYQAARDDDIQSAAVMALEALGSGLMVSPERIDDGKAALGNVGSFERLQDMLINIGVIPGGVAHFMRKTGTQCIAAFVLAASLKTILSDEQIGDVFYEMLVYQGLIQKPELRCSRDQLSKVISAISGYTDGIIPNATVTAVLDALQRSSNPSPRWMKSALAQPGAKTLAKLLSALYSSLQKEDVEVIIVKGKTGCIAVASSLLWLQGDDVQIVADGRVITKPPTSPPKLSIQLNTTDSRMDGSWTVEEWRETTLVSSMVVIDTTSDRMPPALPSFVPAYAAKAALTAQYELDGNQGKQVGQIATALVLVAVERGLVTVGPSTPGGAPREVRLQNICQSAYLAKVIQCMDCYGWSNEEVEGAEAFATEIKKWADDGFQGLDENETGRVEHPLQKRPIDCIIWILKFVSTVSSAKTGYADHKMRSKVAEAAIHVAAESLYSSLCSRFPKSRFFRTGNYAVISDNGAFIMHWIVRHEGIFGRNDIPKQMAKLASRVLEVITLQSLRCNCMASLLPAAGTSLHELTGFIDTATGSGVHRDDLAYASNGYVAWLPQLRAISTLPRSVMAVEISAGYMRCHANESDQNATLVRIQAEESTYQLGDDEGNQPSRANLHPFDTQGNYIGFQPFSDIDGLQIKHYWHQSGRVLKVRTNVLHPASSRVYTVNWMDSVEALVGARHLVNQRIPGFAEKSLAEEWQKTNVWPSISLVPAVPVLEAPASARLESSPVRCISRTYGNEELRFFFAGNVSIHKLYVCHGDASIVNCIRLALQDEGNSQMPGWERFPGTSDRIEDWMNPPMATHIVSPGWFIIL
ncbi:hypothetical protein CSOJ01_13520 [Colletotrichum sojae]|uniref:Uncharacterized protein n=1 Tax=Colletotrichum sojae TaxID=2175907 RepID=A0A8H6ML91_9PEZI|nr:hypothetical protein CSOJ01_13520 [Colletotrichum sojae]